MTRWIMFALTLIGFALAFAAKSPGVLALGLLLGGVSLFGFIFALAADRIAAGARPDASMATPEDLAALGRRTVQRLPGRAPMPGAARGDDAHRIE